MDNLDSDFSDDDFEGYINEDEWLEEEWVGRLVCSRKMEEETVLWVHGSTKRMNSNGMDWVVNDGRDGMVMDRGEWDGGGMDGSDNSDGTEGSETGWIMMDR